METTERPSSIESEKLVHRDRNQSISRIVAHFSTFDKEYFVSDHGIRAALLVARDGNVLLVKQYRLLIDGLSFEIPGGKVEHGEAADVAAVRECLEETGVQCLNVRPLIGFHPSLDIWKNYTYVFSTDQTEDKSRQQNHTCWVPLQECVDMIFSKQIVDSLSIIAILTYYTLRKLS